MEGRRQRREGCVRHLPECSVCRVHFTISGDQTEAAGTLPLPPSFSVNWVLQASTQGSGKKLVSQAMWTVQGQGPWS